MKFFLSKADCLDGSDENFCYKVSVPRKNNRNLPAKPLLNSNITEVELKLYVARAIIDINLVTISVDVSITWRDPSLIFYNLQEDPLANKVDVDALNRFWMPTVIYYLL